jgi:hypothetical protein
MERLHDVVVGTEREARDATPPGASAAMAVFVSYDGLAAVAWSLTRAAPRSSRSSPRSWPDAQMR